MTKVIRGTAGIDFDITEVDTDLPTGNITQVHQVNPEIKSLLVDSADLVASMNGFIGTTHITLNLLDLKTKSATNGELTLIRNNTVVFSKMKSIIFHNVSSSGHFDIIGITNSFISFEGSSDPRLAIFKGESVQFTFPSKDVTGSFHLLKLQGSENSVDLEIYFLGS